MSLQSFAPEDTYYYMRNVYAVVGGNKVELPYIGELYVFPEPYGRIPKIGAKLESGNTTLNEIIKDIKKRREMFEERIKKFGEFYNKFYKKSELSRDRAEAETRKYLQIYGEVLATLENADSVVFVGTDESWIQ